MAFHNMLSICVLITALATGDCFFSNLMNEPLNFAVSLLDGQAHSEANYHTTEYGPQTPVPITVAGNAGTTFTAMPSGPANLKGVVANKLAAYIGGASKKSIVHHSQAIRHNSGISSKHSSSSTTEITAAPSSDESSSKTTWKHVRPAPKRPSKKAYNQRVKASISTGRRHSSHGRINARHAPSKAGHKHRQSGWKKSSWGANRSSGSGEKYPVVTAKQAKSIGSSSSSSEENVILVQKTLKSANKLRRSSKNYPVVNAKHASEGFGSSSSSSEENIIFIHKTTKPANKLRRSSKTSGWKNNRSSGSGGKYPVVTAKQAKGFGSSSSEENVILIENTPKPANKLRRSRKKNGWKKNRWASNRSSGSGEKYPDVNARPAKGVGSSSSSSEDNVVLIVNNARPANKLRGSSKKNGWKKNRWASNRSSGSGEKYPDVNAKPAKGVGSSSSSEDNVILIENTPKPAKKLRGSSKKNGWKNNRWASNRSSGSGEKYPDVNAKPAKGVGSSSSSSEDNVILIENNTKPAHSYRALKRQSYRGYGNRAAGGYKSKRRFNPKLQGAGLCHLCRG